MHIHPSLPSPEERSLTMHTTTSCYLPNNPGGRDGRTRWGLLDRVWHARTPYRRRQCAPPPLYAAHPCSLAPFSCSPAGRSAFPCIAAGPPIRWIVRRLCGVTVTSLARSLGVRWRRRAGRSGLCWSSDREDHGGWCHPRQIHTLNICLTD